MALYNLRDEDILGEALDAFSKGCCPLLQSHAARSGDGCCLKRARQHREASPPSLSCSSDTHEELLVPVAHACAANDAFLVGNGFGGTYLPESFSPRSSPPCTPSALTSCLAEPSQEEEEVLSLLASTQQQLDALRAAAPENPRHGGAKKLAAAVQRMERVVEALAATAEQHVALQRRHRLVRMQLALAEREQAYLALLQTLPFPNDGMSGSIASVNHLPRAGQWDAAWDARVLSLRMLDLLLLHKQWLQHSALKLPRVQALRGDAAGEAAAAELRDLYDRYMQFTHHVMRLQPELWHESATYDLETLQPMVRPPTGNQLRSFYKSVSGSGDKVQPIYAHYQQVISGLCAEEAALQRRYAQLVGALSCDTGSNDRAQACVEADWTLKQIQANLCQQRLQASNAVHAVNYALPIEQAVQLRVMMYPVAAIGQEVLEDMYQAARQ